MQLAHLVLTNLLVTQNKETELIRRRIFTAYRRSLKTLRSRITGNGPRTTYADLYQLPLTQTPHFSYLRSLCPEANKKRQEEASSEGSSVLNRCWKCLHLFMAYRKEHTALIKVVGCGESRIRRQVRGTCAAS